MKPVYSDIYALGDLKVTNALRSSVYIALLDNRPVGLLGWGAATFKSTPRDKWIGWSPEIQWQRLKFIANNMRFLVLVWIKNLASRILSFNLKRLAKDWEGIYGHPIVLAETF